MPGKLGRLAQGLPTSGVLPTTIQHPNGALYASGFALSLEEERQPKIWKSRVTNAEERLIASMSGTLFALFEKRRIDREIRDPQEILRYFGNIHQRTMNVVGAIPRGKVDCGFRPDKFTLGDLVRHIAASNACIFLEVAKGNRSSYHGCGKEYGASYDEIAAFTEQLHRQAIETLSPQGGCRSRLGRGPAFVGRRRGTGGACDDRANRSHCAASLAWMVTAHIFQSVFHSWKGPGAS